MTITLEGGITFFGITLSPPPPPPENTAAWFGGGQYPYTSTVDRITFATDTATATTRGPLSLTRTELAAAGNFTDGWFGGGYNNNPGFTNPLIFSTVDRITYATDTATASVRGPLSQVVYRQGAAGNSTNGWFGGGGASPGPVTSVPPLSTVLRITYATDTATASVRGPLSLARQVLAAVGNSDYGWFGGGMEVTTAVVSTVDRITYATDTATASVRGPLSAAKYKLAAVGNSDYGWFGGGKQPTVSTVQRITYATDTATASVRGPLSAGRYQFAAAGNTTDGWFGGGRGTTSLVDRITYATDTATASVRGPLSAGRYLLAAAGGVQ